MNKPPTPRDEKFEELVIKERSYYHNHINSCYQTYKWMEIVKEHLELSKQSGDERWIKKETQIYALMLKSSESLVRNRIFMIYKRLFDALSNLWILHDNKYSCLFVYIGKDKPINKKYFYLYVLPEENLSEIYVHLNIMTGNSIQKKIDFYNFENLKVYLSECILKNIKNSIDKEGNKDEDVYKSKRSSSHIVRIKSSESYNDIRKDPKDTKDSNKKKYSKNSLKKFRKRKIDKNNNRSFTLTSNLSSNNVSNCNRIDLKDMRFSLF